MNASTIVVCPDSFKGSADAAAVAAAIAQGWRRARPDDRLILLPMADGGEGTIDALAAAWPGAERVPVPAVGPDGTPREAAWLRLPRPEGDAAVVELALTSGLTLPRPPDGRDASTRGFGQAIAAALDAGVHRVLVALGGSATSDGGAGALEALGAHLTDAAGAGIVAGNRGLADLATLDLSGIRPLPAGGVQVLADVRSPLLGPAGAITVFGPQKGIAPADLPAAEQAMARFARLGEWARGTDPATPGAGAAGGTGFGMLLWGATIVPGARTVAREIGLEEALRAADAVVTGEGRFDAQSEQGKVVTEVRALADAAGVPTLLVAGAIAGDTSRFAGAASLVDAAGSVAAAIAEPARYAAGAAETLARHFVP